MTANLLDKTHKHICPILNVHLKVLDAQTKASTIFPRKHFYHDSDWQQAIAAPPEMMLNKIKYDISQNNFYHDWD